MVFCFVFLQTYWVWTAILFPPAQKQEQMNIPKPTCKFDSIPEDRTICIETATHLSIPYTDRATLTYTAKICDCTLDLIVSQPPLPTKRYNRVPSTSASPALLQHMTGTVPHSIIITPEHTTLAISFSFFVLFFPPLLLIRERPPRCISSFTGMPSRQ